ncbi:MAG: phage baseplate assembly protein V, partial [Saprospiraceae bacterium]
VWTDDGKTHIAKPDFSAQPTFTLQYTSQQIVEFEAEIDARNSWTGVDGYTWDSADQSVEQESAIEPGLTEQGDVPASDVADALHKEPAQLYHTGQLEPIEVQNWADAALQRSRLAKVRGRVSIIGQPKIKPMDWIAFDGFGNRFNGPAFVAGVRHEVKRGVWITHIEFGLSPQPYARQAAADLSDLPAAGRTPAIHGLHIGTVTSVDNPDATSGHLVQVVIPYLGQVAGGGTSDGIWARLSNVTAGDDRGMVFRPEVGDEVVVGFVNDDPNHAILLGALHSANAPAPVAADDKNPEKGIYCREGMKLIFNDDEKSITILTDAGNTITLSDNDQSIKIEDQRGAKLEMNAQGITLDAGSGNVTIQGTMINIG